jgi:hypothetical protein
VVSARFESIVFHSHFGSAQWLCFLLLLLLWTASVIDGALLSSSVFYTANEVEHSGPAIALNL